MTRRPTIVVPFATTFGGVERLAVALCRYLHRRGADPRVVSLRCTLDLSTYAGYPVRVETLDPPRNPLAEANRLASAVRAGSDGTPALVFDLKGAFYAGLAAPPPFVLHLTDPPSLLPAEVSKAGWTPRRQHPPLAAGPAPGLLRAVRGEAVHRLTARGVRRAARVVVMTNAIAAEVGDLYRVVPAVVRPGVPPLTESARARPVPPWRLLSVSRLEPSKRLDWVLDALSTLPGGGWVLDVAGDGSDRPRLESLADRLGLAERVQFHGRVSEGRLEELYAGAALFLMPAVQGYGLPALEALTRGVPVVLSRGSGVAEVLGRTSWATVFDGGPAELAAAVRDSLARRAAGADPGPPPAVPDEDDWAAALCRTCGWSE